MSDRIVYLDPDPHAAVQKLLPWYVSGRLDAAERAEVAAHLADCPLCRSELAFEETLQAAIRGGDETAADADAGWAGMLRRIDATTPEADAPARRSPRPAPSAFLGGRLPVTAWALPGLLSVALVVSLVVTFEPTRTGQDYHALAAPVADGATAVVRFRADATEAQIRQSLVASGARLVDGPTVTDAYVVRLPRERYAEALVALRGQPAVTLVEALQGAASP